MKTTLHKIARVVMFAGFVLFVGTLVTHEFIMDSPGWSGRHPGWIDWFLPIALVLFFGGVAACVLTKKPTEKSVPSGRDRTIDLIIIIFLIGILAAILFPTVC